MAPPDDNRDKTEALQVASLLSTPLAPFLNPSAVAQFVLERFGLNLSEFLVDTLSAVHVQALETHRQMLLGLNPASSQANGQTGGPALPAALDAAKSEPSQNAQRNLLPTS